MNNTVLSAVQHVKRMRGGSQAQLMRASDGNYYVVKFQNCPQQTRILANEFLATKIGLALGLPMPEVFLIEVTCDLVSFTPDLYIEIGQMRIPCKNGLQLAVRYAADPWQDHTVDYMPQRLFDRVVNRLDLIRVLAFDKWLSNCDSRQVVFTKKRNERLYRLTCIDQGNCFNAERWSFLDRPLLGTYRCRSVYSDVTSWDSFEPALSRIEGFEPAQLWECATAVPEEWYQGQTQKLTVLIEKLLERRLAIRDSINRLRNCSENPFPKWMGN